MRVLLAPSRNARVLLAPRRGHAVRKTQWGDACHREGRSRNYGHLSRILDVDMDLASAQTNDGEMQIDTKQIEKYGEREGTSERERREERHNGATGQNKLP